jgi:hypothetical protein
MSTIVTRAGKGSPLTHTEVDNNFTNLNTDKYQSGNNASFGTLSASGAFSANGGTTLGDASGDALTINSSAVSIPNGLNFDSNTLVIDATNNRVGVGTASPATRLVVGSSTGNYGLQIAPRSDFPSISGQLLFSDETGSACMLSISGGLTFSTGATVGSNSGTERMRITSTGNVGIGISDPSEKLDVRGIFVASDANRQFVRLRMDSAVARIESTFASGASGAYRPLAFSTSDAERMRIDTSGNVGIGTSSPTAYSAGDRLLQVHATVNSSELKLTNATTGTGATAGFVALQSGNDTYLWNGSNSFMSFGTNNSERMRIGSNGNIGIGTTATDAAVNIYGTNGTASSSTTFWNLTYAGMVIRNSSDTANTVAGIAFQGGSSGNSNSAIGNIAESTSLGALAFYTGGSGRSNTVPERMRIDSSGNLLVGTTNALSARASIKTSVSGGTAISTDNPDSVTYLPMRFHSNTTLVGYIESSSTATSYVTSSDYRLKENIAPMTGALSKVAQLKPCTYTWKSNGEASQGFIAHELQAVVPDAVTGEKDAVNEDGSIKPQGIDTSFLVATLTASIQELKAIVDAQAARIALLESK